MSSYLRTVSDKELGAIAEVVDDVPGKVLGSCAASQTSSDGIYTIHRHDRIEL